MLKLKLLPTLKEHECDRLLSAQDKGKEDMTLTSLEKNHALISALCWRVVRNEGYAYWAIVRVLKACSVLVTDSGVIFMSQRGQGWLIAWLPSAGYGTPMM